MTWRRGGTLSSYFCVCILQDTNGKASVMDKEHSSLNILNKFSELYNLNAMQVNLVETLCNYGLIYIFLIVTRECI